MAYSRGRVSGVKKNRSLNAKVEKKKLRAIREVTSGANKKKTREKPNWDMGSRCVYEAEEYWLYEQNFKHLLNYIFKFPLNTKKLFIISLMLSLARTFFSRVIP